MIMSHLKPTLVLMGSALIFIVSSLILRKKSSGGSPEA